MNLIYISVTFYILIKTFSFSIYKIKHNNFKAFTVSIVLNIALAIIAFIYYI